MSRWSDRKAAQMRVPQWRARRSPGLLLPVLAAVLAIAALLTWYFAAGQRDLPRAEAPAPAKAASQQADEAAGEPVITLSAAVQRQNGIETAAPRRQAYQEQVRAYGTVLDASTLTALDNKLADAKAQVAMAEARLAAAKAAFSRAQLLFRNQQNVSKAEMQSAEAAFRTDQAGLGAAEAQRRNLAATAMQEWGAVLGKDLATNGPLTTGLIARQNFLVQVALPAGSTLREPPRSAAIEAAGRRVPIRFVSAAPRVDPKFQGVGYLYVAAAESGVLPGMDVPVFLADGKAAEGMLVPASAVVWWQGRAWAYLRTGADTFARRMIPTSVPTPDGSGGYIAQDLPQGAQLVVQGAQLLLSQEFRSQIDVED